MSDLICIGVPYFLGQPRTEVSDIELSGFAADIGADWVNVTPDFARYSDPILAVNCALAETIAAHRSQFPIIFASDCTSAIGAAKGLQRGDLGLIWFDAHGDFNTPETSISGFLGGMPLAMLVGRGLKTYTEGVGLQPIREDDVILTDARDLDAAEAVALRNSAIRHLLNFADLQTAALPDRPLYVHLDVDVVNPQEMPDQKYTTPGGPSMQVTADVVRRVARDGQVAGVLLALCTASGTSKLPVEGTLTLARAFVAGMRDKERDT